MTDAPATNELLALADLCERTAQGPDGYRTVFSGTLTKCAKALRAAAIPSAEVSVETPSVIDNNNGEITVSLNSKELRGWSYSSDQERRSKMLCAREYVEGYCDGRQS